MLVVGLVLVISTTACGSSGTASPSPVQKWSKAYAFLAAQTKPTEMLCSWVETTADGRSMQAEKPVGFYSFADRASWQPHLQFHMDRVGASWELCEATVPVSVPNGPAVNAFLAKYGLATGRTVPGKTDVMIAYLGQGPTFLKNDYRDKPGLYGLYLAFAALQLDPFNQNLDQMTQPTDDATATTYLRFAQPLLAWYGYNG